MQVYIIREDGMDNFERAVNRFIANRNVVDIKFSTVAILGSTTYMAMIMYND